MKTSSLKIFMTRWTSIDQSSTIKAIIELTNLSTALGLAQRRPHRENGFEDNSRVFMIKIGRLRCDMAVPIKCDS